MVRENRKSDRREFIFMKKKRNPALIAALLFFAAAIGAAAFYTIARNLPNSRKADLAAYYHIKEAGEAGLVCDGMVSEHPARVLDGQLYLPAAFLRERPALGLYYDAAEHLLIRTCPEEVLTFPADGTDESFLLKNEVPYVSLAFVEANCPAEATVTADFNGDPESVSLRTEARFEEADVLAGGAVLRTDAGIRHPVLAELPEGTKVRVLADINAEEGWTAVQSGGYSGFVKTEELSKSRETEEKLPNAQEFSHLLSEDRISLAFHQVTDQASNDALPEYIREVSGVTDLAPTWFFLESGEGEVSSLADGRYVRRAAEKKLGVWAVFNDFDGKAGGRATGEALSGYSRREKMIRTVVEGVLEAGADGICIDFENVTASCAADFIEFIRELSASCRREKLVLSVCNYTPLFTKYYNRGQQAKAADYIICMCYDEHTKNSARAGSVASMAFVREGIDATLAEVPKEQVIAAFPFYTRIWETKDDVILDCRAAGMAGAASFVEENGLAVTRDEAVGQDYAVKEEGGKKTEIWLENRYSLERKLAAAEDAGLAGVAVWKLGFETADIWELFSAYAGKLSA